MWKYIISWHIVTSVISKLIAIILIVLSGLGMVYCWSVKNSNNQQLINEISKRDSIIKSKESQLDFNYIGMVTSVIGKHQTVVFYDANCNKKDYPQILFTITLHDSLNISKKEVGDKVYFTTNK